MLRIVVVGAGAHSRGQHLPSLSRFVEEHPGQIELAALCDLDAERASLAGRQFGFGRIYEDLSEMLRVESPSGCIAVTPIPVTAQVAKQVIEAGVPLCMEKPPGATPEEARVVAELVQATGAHVMVSVNRRFDPALTAAMAWWGDHPMTYVSGCLARVDRREDFFVTGTAIHAVDALRAIAGDVSDFTVEGRTVDGVRWFFLREGFANGAVGSLDVMPSAGQNIERYEISGPGRRAVISSGYLDAGDVTCWEGGVLALQSRPADGMPDYVRAGSYAETCAFIDALRTGRAPGPTPMAVLQSLEICHQMDASFPQPGL